NPHGENLRVYFNDAAVTTKANQAADISTPAETGTMVVKEIYDVAGTLLGHAVNIKDSAGDGSEFWTYYCNLSNDSGLCGVTETLPIFQKGEGFSGCAICHGEAVIAPLP